MASSLVRVLLVSLAGFAAAWAPAARASTATSTADEARIAAEVSAVVHAVGDAAQRLDVDAALKDVWVDPRALLVVSEGHPVPVAEFREDMRGFYASMSRLVFTTLGDEVRVLSADLALEAWTYRVEGTARSGARFVIDTETATFLVRRIDGAWKILFFQESASAPKRLGADDARPAQEGAPPTTPR